jgi:hypothetical protein
VDEANFILMIGYNNERMDAPESDVDFVSFQMKQTAKGTNRKWIIE